MRLIGFDALYRRPGNSDVLFSALREETVRLQDNLLAPSKWTALSPDDVSEETILADFGRYLFLRMDFLPDGSPDNIPFVQNITLRYERDPALPAPGNIVVLPGDASLRLFWDRVLGAEGYLLYYGEAPGSYFGRDSSLGTSPIDLGNVNELVLEGLVPRKMYYFRIASYNADKRSPARPAPGAQAEP